jgi:hypothetical protein
MTDLSKDMKGVSSAIAHGRLLCLGETEDNHSDNHSSRCRCRQRFWPLKFVK